LLRLEARDVPRSPAELDPVKRAARVEEDRLIPPDREDRAPDAEVERVDGRSVTRAPRSMVRTTEGARERRTVCREYVAMLVSTPAGRTARTDRPPMETVRSLTRTVGMGRPTARWTCTREGELERTRTLPGRSSRKRLPGVATLATFSTVIWFHRTKLP